MQHAQRGVRTPGRRGNELGRPSSGRGAPVSPLRQANGSKRPRNRGAGALWGAVRNLSTAQIPLICSNIDEQIHVGSFRHLCALVTFGVADYLQGSIRKQFVDWPSSYWSHSNAINTKVGVYP